MTMTTTLQIAQIVSPTEAEGPGARMAIWLQGCPLRCPGCCNPAMLPFEGGEAMTVEAILARADGDAIEGLSLLGGEPTAQPAGVAALAGAARERGLTIMVYSGHTLDELRGRNDADIDRLLARTDLLVDGPYIREQPDTTRRWIGSSNQGLHFLSDAYRPDDPRFAAGETIEIRLSPGALTVNGWPEQAEALRRQLLVKKRGGVA